MRGAASAAVAAPSRDFLLERLHSLAGVVPLGAFLVEHILGNAFAVRSWGGPEAYDRYVLFLLGTPFLKGFLELFLVYLPLAFHGWYGLAITRRATANVGRYGFERNWAYLVQRVTGVVLIAYIVTHVISERFASEIGVWASHAAFMSPAQLADWHRAPSAPYQHMVAVLSIPAYYAFSYLGLLAATLHFAQGLWSFCVRWGIVVGARAQTGLKYACGALFVALSLAGVAALNSFTPIGR
ncbi:MAG TPA: succinate dehydrogenase [Planctomycetota bacterium]|nr:succinate dehydrogenase [Planctomycetota bacterium]